MVGLFNILWSNALFATGLAVVVFVLARFSRNPYLLHGICVIVLLKLVAPPIFSIDLAAWFPAGLSASERVNLPRAALAPADAGQEAIVASAGGVSDMVPAPAEGEANHRSPVGAHGAAAVQPVEFLHPPAVSRIPGPSAKTSAAGVAVTVWKKARPWVLGFWAAGIVVAVLGVLRHFRRMRQLVAASTPVNTRVNRLGDAVQGCLRARCWGGAKQPRIRLLAAPISPLVWFVWGPPVVLLPARLVDELDDEQLASVLMHEFNHIRRGDHLVRWLEMLAGCLFWWHPLVWWVRRELRTTEEACCDADVLALLPESAPAYAQALLQTVELIRGGPRNMLPLAIPFGRHGQFKRRLEMILSTGSLPQRTRCGQALIVLLAATLPLAITAVAEVRGEAGSAERVLQPPTDYPVDPNAAKLARLRPPAGNTVAVELRLLDQKGRPPKRPVVLAWAHVGFPGLNDVLLAGATDRKGQVTFGNVLPGPNTLVADPGRADRTVLYANVPTTGGSLELDFQARVAEAKSPELQVVAATRLTMNRNSISDESRGRQRELGGPIVTVLAVTIVNRSDAPYRLTDTDCNLFSDKLRVFPPKTAGVAGVVLPAGGKQSMTVLIPWDEYLQAGLWIANDSAADHQESLPLLNHPPGQAAFRVQVAGAYSAPLALAVPSYPGQPAATVPAPLPVVPGPSVEPDVPIIPEARRDRPFGELGFPDGDYGPHWEFVRLVTHAPVQEEVGLSALQREILKPIYARIMDCDGEWNAGRDNPEFLKHEHEVAERLLTEVQKSRMAELQLQRKGIPVFFDPDFQQKLALTTEQVGQVRALWQAHVERARSGWVGDSGRRALHRLWQQVLDDVLTPQQRAQFLEMSGPLWDEE